MRHVLGILVAIVSIAWPDAGRADEPSTFTPAILITGNKHSIDKKIVFPKTDSDVSVLVRCRGRVRITGRFYKLDCFYHDEIQWRSALAVQRAARVAKLTPATIDGKKVPISIYFSVSFQRSENEQQVSVYQNWGINSDIYGTNYIAAQPWLFRRPSRACRNASRRYRVDLSMLVKADGTAHDVELHAPDEGFPDTCRESIKRAKLEEKYIPAYHEGMPVDSLHNLQWFGQWHRARDLWPSFTRPQFDNDSEHQTKEP